MDNDRPETDVALLRPEVLMGGTPLLDRNLSALQLREQAFAGLATESCRCNDWRAIDCRFDNWTADHTQVRAGRFLGCRFSNLQATTCFFTASTFCRSTFDRLKAGLTAFDRCCFEAVQMRGSELSEVSFIGSLWHNSIVEEVDWSFVRLPESLFVNTVFRNCRLQKAIFRLATLVNCVFENCQLDDAVFHRAELKNTTFPGTDLDRAANLDCVKGLS